VVLATLLAVIVEYAGVMGPLVGAGRRYDGPLGKSDRAFVFGVLGAGVATGLLPIDWLDTLFMLIAALLLWTLANRVRQGIAEADRNTPPA
jgi:CDP-diacylglycerol--glycerol-3-phosphate 3-phosphatidyltransferase